MKLRTAQRQMSRIKMALQGPSGSGKTYTSLLLAKGLTGSLDKVAIIDTENGSADLYAHLGAYQVLTLSEPYSPERYIQAIEQCEMAGIECIIIDSITQCWDFLLEFHANLVGNSFTNWGKVTPRHKAFVTKLLQSPVHIICTMRVKQEYVLNEKNGKTVPEKVGLKAVQRDGMDYEFTIVFDLDSNHFATCTKDRTGLFANKPLFRIKESTGKEILNWLTDTKPDTPLEQRVEACSTIQELMELYEATIQEHPNKVELFSTRRNEIITRKPFKNQSNGTTNHP